MNDLIRLASSLDSRGQYDLADRVDQMTRLALRGKDLATMYALQGLQTPTGESQLSATPWGRKQLLSVAKDMIRRIKPLNDGHISDEAFDHHIYEEVDNMMDYGDSADDERGNFVDNIIYDVGRNWRINNQSVTSPEFVNAAMGELYDRMKTANMEDLKNNRTRTIRNMKALQKQIANGQRELDNIAQASLRYHEEDLVKIAEKMAYWKRPQDFSESWFMQLRDDHGIEPWGDPIDRDTFSPIDLDDEFRKFMMELMDSEDGNITIIHDAITNNREQYEDSFYDMNRPHWAIDEQLQALQGALADAQHPNATDEDFDELAAQVDHLVHMNHCNGSVMEYADEVGPEDESGPSIDEIMNRKYGKGFLPYANELGLIPKKALQMAEEGAQMGAHDQYMRSLGPEEGTSREIDRNWNRDDYYRHPSFQNPQQWTQQQYSPSMQELFNTPQGEAARINTENVLQDTMARGKPTGWNDEAARLHKMNYWARRDIYDQWAKKTGRPQPAANNRMLPFAKTNSRFVKLA